jgi:hypothetical protein
VLALAAADADIRSEAHDLPFIAAAGVPLAHAHDIPETDLTIWHVLAPKGAPRPHVALHHPHAARHVRTPLVFPGQGTLAPDRLFDDSMVAGFVHEMHSAASTEGPCGAEHGEYNVSRSGWTYLRFGEAKRQA